VGVIGRGIASDAGLTAEWLFTDRHGGVSEQPFASLNVGASVGDDPQAVARNREIAASYLAADSLGMMHQVHGRAVAILDEPAHPPPQADGVMTRAVGLPLVVQVADCVPVLVADLAGGSVAAVHAGWRGVAADVVGATVEALAPVGPVHAWVGPAICPGCYEVSDEVRAEVADVVPEAFATTSRGTPAIDLRRAVRAQLSAHGIDAVLVGSCTFESPDLFSFRRDAVTGRQAGLIVMRQRP